MRLWFFHCLAAMLTMPRKEYDRELYKRRNGIERYFLRLLTVMNSGMSAGSVTAGGPSVNASGYPTVGAPPGGTVSVEATGAEAGTKLTYKIVDGSRNIAAYGQGADNAGVSVNAKNLTGADLADGSYTVYVWA